MKYRKLGRTGLEVSETGFGAWAVYGNWGEQKEDESVAALHKAIDNGVKFSNIVTVFDKSSFVVL